MDFERGSEVVSSEGESIGKLRRVVIDPATKKVAALIVERGLFFTEDKLVSLTLVDRVEDGRVILSGSKEGLEELENFEETHFVPRNEAGEQLEAYYWNPPTQGLTNSPYPVLPHPVYVESSRPNLPENTIALKEGARVLTEDGVHAGNLERVIMDPQTEQVTHFVISSGFLTRERKLLPAHWIKDVTEDEVQLSVESSLFDRLVEYPTRE